jgi:NADPH:quinone reductase-like Zn-dependent oxidoreductase
MRSWHLQGLGAGLDGLQLRERALPRPGPREVLVRVRACALNYREIGILQLGRYPLPITPGAVALCDGAGEVVELGAGASRWRPGDRVVAAIFPHWQDGPFGPDSAAQLGGSLDGMLAEHVVLPEDALVAIPPHLDDEEAATLPCAAVTAWNALAGGLPLAAGDDVLVLGSGGVSLFALQLAKAAGARVVATTSSAAKAERLRALGADEVIDYGLVPDWGEHARRLSGGRGVQHVVEVGGGATMAQSLKAVAVGGEIAFVGALAGSGAAIDPAAMFLSGATLRAVAAGSRAQLQRVARIVERHRLRPVVARVFGFDDARAALAWYARGEAFGKTVIRVA